MSIVEYDLAPFEKRPMFHIASVKLLLVADGDNELQLCKKQQAAITNQDLKPFMRIIQ